MTVRSRIHAGRVRISEFHPWGKVMKVIHLRRIPAFFYFKTDKFAHVKILFILTPPLCLSVGNLSVKAWPLWGACRSLDQEKFPNQDFL